MVPYDTVLKTWQKWNVGSVSDLDLQLKHFRILFAYHSSKISLILEIHRILTAGAYDERRYIINGERPGGKDASQLLADAQRLFAHDHL